MGGMGGGNQGPGSSSLDKLIKAWGLQFDTSKVVADLDFKMQLQGPNGQPQDAPTWLGLNAEGINTNDMAALTGEMDNIWLPDGRGVHWDTGVRSYGNGIASQQQGRRTGVDGLMATMGGDVLRGFTPKPENDQLCPRHPVDGDNVQDGGSLDGKPNQPNDASNTNQVAAGGTSLKQSAAETSRK